MNVICSQIGFYFEFEIGLLLAYQHPDVPLHLNCRPMCLHSCIGKIIDYGIFYTCDGHKTMHARSYWYMSEVYPDRKKSKFVQIQGI